MSLLNRSRIIVFIFSAGRYRSLAASVHLLWQISHITTSSAAVAAVTAAMASPSTSRTLGVSEIKHAECLEPVESTGLRWFLLRCLFSRGHAEFSQSACTQHAPLRCPIAVVTFLTPRRQISHTRTHTHSWQRRRKESCSGLREVSCSLSLPLVLGVSLSLSLPPCVFGSLSLSPPRWPTRFCYEIACCLFYK